MRQLRHPLSGALYEMENDLVKVTTRDGRVGFFDAAGVWVRGEKFSADPHVCVWVGGPQLPSRYQVAVEARDGGEDLFAPTGGQS